MMKQDIPVDQILNPDYVKQCKKKWCWTFVNEMRDEQFPEARKCAGVGELPGVIYPGNVQQAVVDMEQEVTDFMCPDGGDACAAGEKVKEQKRSLMNYIEKEFPAGTFGQGTTIDDLAYGKSQKEAYQAFQKLKEIETQKKWENAGFFGTIFWLPKKIFWKTKAFVDGPWYAEEAPDSEEYKACHGSFGETANCFFTAPLSQSSILNIRRAVLTWICIITGVSLMGYVGKKLIFPKQDAIDTSDKSDDADTPDLDFLGRTLYKYKDGESSTDANAVMETVKDLRPLHKFLLFAGVAALLAACIGPCVIAIVL